MTYGAACFAAPFFLRLTSCWLSRLRDSLSDPDEVLLLRVVNVISESYAVLGIVDVVDQRMNHVDASHSKSRLGSSDGTASGDFKFWILLKEKTPQAHD